VELRNHGTVSPPNASTPIAARNSKGMSVDFAAVNADFHALIMTFPHSAIFEA
jgi:hypothetical protein